MAGELQRQFRQRPRQPVGIGPTLAPQPPQGCCAGPDSPSATLPRSPCGMLAGSCSKRAMNCAVDGVFPAPHPAAGGTERPLSALARRSPATPVTGIAVAADVPQGAHEGGAQIVGQHRPWRTA